MAALEEDEWSTAPVAYANGQAGAATRARPGQRRRPRQPVNWLPRVAWPAGLAVGGIILFLCYLNVSRTQPVLSDGASNALQAWDMLHGNLLLHGWRLTDVSFYTTELPEYMIVEAIRGLQADVLHVSAAISYTLVVLLGGLLGRGRATGREGVVRFVIAAGIMVAPQLGPGVFILVLQPDHIGTQVPLLATWLVLDRAPVRLLGGTTPEYPPARAWYVPPVVAVMLAWAAVADRLVVAIGAIPLAVISAMRAYQTLVQHRERLRSAWFDLSLLAAALTSVPISSIADKQLSEHGGYTLMPLMPGLAPITDMSSHFWLAVESVSGLYGADLFGMSSPGLRAAIAMLHLVGLALAAWGLWLALRGFFRGDDRIAQVLALGIVINIAAYMLNTTPSGYWGARELAAVLPAGAVLAGRMLGRRLLAARLVPALAVVLACYLGALGYAAAQPPVPAVSQDLADWLVAHHFTYGLSSYGLANATTLASGGAVDLRPTNWYSSVVAAGPYEYDRSWYNPQAHDANFFVLLGQPNPLDPIADWQVRDAFGKPAHTYVFGRYVILTWNTNLLTELSPSLPTPPPS